jgi:hypothetical protein
MSRPCRSCQKLRTSKAESCEILSARTAFFPISPHKLMGRRKLNTTTLRGMDIRVVSFWPNGRACWSPCSAAKIHRTTSQFAGAFSTEVIKRRDPATPFEIYGKRTSGVGVGMARKTSL